MCVYGTVAMCTSFMSVRMENYLKWQICRWNVYIEKKHTENVEQNSVLVDQKG